MGWALFSISVVCLCWLLLQVVAGVAYCIRCWALITGSVMLCAQLVSTPFAAFQCLTHKLQRCAAVSVHMSCYGISQLVLACEMLVICSR